MICDALLAFGAAPASAQCGQTINVSPRHSFGPGPPPLAVGDSVLYDAADALSYYGFATNAMVCRTMAQGIVWLEDHAHALPPLVVIALGTNGAVTPEQIDQLLTIVGPSRMLAMVTPHHGNYAYVPGLIRAAGKQHPGRIVVLDWDRLSANHPDWFAPDGIHLGDAAGISAFARLVAGALLAVPTPAPTVVRPAPAPARRPAPAPRMRRRVQLRNPAPAKPALPAAVTRAGATAWLVLGAVEALGFAFAGG